MGNADALSRLPLADSEKYVPVPGDIRLLFEKLSTSIVTAAQIKIWTDKDPVLARVRRFVLGGWTATSPGQCCKVYRYALKVKDHHRILEEAITGTK